MAGGLTRLSTPDLEREGGAWPFRDCARVVDAGGVRWHVVVTGAGPVVALLHGPGGGLHVWAPLIRLLATSFTVVAPDLPGHGFTHSFDGEALPDPDSIATALRSLVDALTLEPALVVCHAAGLAVAARFAASNESAVLGVVGISPALEVPPNLPLGSARKLIGDAFGMDQPRLTDRFVARFLAGLAKRPDLLERLLASSGSELPQSSVALHRTLAAHAGHVAAALALVARTDIGAVLESVRAMRAPLLLLAGDRDGWISMDECEEFARVSHRGLLVRLADAGHFAQEDQPESVARFIREMAGALGLIR